MQPGLSKNRLASKAAQSLGRGRQGRGRQPSVSVDNGNLSK